MTEKKTSLPTIKLLLLLLFFFSGFAGLMYELVWIRVLSVIVGKTIGAATIAENLSSVTTKACFMMKDREEYLKLIESAHQTLLAAVGMAEDARNLQKATNNIYRTPHAKDGKIVTKTDFYVKPE